MEEREAINNRAGRERRLFCVEAMLRLGEVGGFCLYCRPHKNCRSRSARALAIDRQATSGATTIVVAETAAFREFTGRIHPDRFIPIGCLCIKDEGHQSG